MTLWNDLLGNLAVVAVATSLWTFGNRWVSRLHSRLSWLLLSVLMSAGVLTVMLMPFEFQQGVYLDLRYTFIAVSSYFGGPLILIPPVIVGLVTRTYIGGTGLWIGIIHILLTAGSSLAIRKLVPKRIPARWVPGTLAASVTVSATAGFFFVIPPAHWSVVVPTTIVPFAVVLTASTLVACLAVLQEQRRQKAADENLVYRAIIEALPDCLNAKDLQGRFIAANPATAVLMQADGVSGLLGRTDFDFYPFDTAREFREVELEFASNAMPMTVEQRFTLPNGEETWLSTLKAPLRNEAGDVIGIITHNREITAHKQIEAQLALVQQRLSEAVSTMADGLAMFDADGVLVFRNARYLGLFPLTAGVRQIGVSLRDIIRASLEQGEDPAVHGCRETMVERIHASLLSPGSRQMQLADGRWMEARTQATSEGGAMVVFSDITHLKETEARLQAQNTLLSGLASTDALTGLANRRSFDEALIEYTLQASRDDQDLALLLIDVDRFKAFNDTYGHQAGDACLKVIASTVRAVTDMEKGSHVARYGGEEIAVILPDISDSDAYYMARRVCEAVRNASLLHTGSELGIVTVSIGVAMMRRRSGRRTADLVRDADRELYRAKSAGRNQVCMEVAGEGPQFGSKLLSKNASRQADF